MYRFFTVFLFILLPIVGYTQKKPKYIKVNHLYRLNKKMTYGYYLGINIYNFLIEYKTESSDNNIQVNSNIGFNIGLIGDMKMGKYFSLRIEPGLSQVSRTLIYPFKGQDDKRIRKVTSEYLRLPFMIKVAGSRYNNIRPYLISGLSVSTDFSSRQQDKTDNSSGVFRTVKYNINYELGGGFEFYFYYFKLTIGLRGVFGITNELIPDKDPNSPWTGNIKSIKSQGFMINIKIQ